MTFWTVLDTSQNAIFTNVGYQFSRKFSIYAGLNGNPGTRSLQGNHPLWLGNDRVMADEFFRPFFGSGVWAQGEVSARSLVQRDAEQHQQHPRRQVEPARSQVDHRRVDVVDADDEGVRSARAPTATGSGTTKWRPDSASPGRGAPSSGSPTALTGGPGNTTLRLADSVNVFETGALAAGVTVDTVDYKILAFDAGMKYKGIFLQTEIYNRWLDNFTADGPLPVASIHDTGFYRAGGVLPREEEARGLRRDLADLRRQGRGLRQQLRVPGRDELLSRSTHGTSGSTCS